jgi:hypothetical protein
MTAESVISTTVAPPGWRVLVITADWTHIYPVPLFVTTARTDGQVMVLPMITQGIDLVPVRTVADQVWECAYLMSPDEPDPTAAHLASSQIRAAQWRDELRSAGLAHPEPEEPK